MQRAIFLLIFLLLCAGGQKMEAANAARPVQPKAPEGPVLYVRIISFQDIATGERLTADVYDAEGALLANDAEHFVYTIQAMQTYTITVKASGYRDFGFGTTALIDRDQQVVIPLQLERE